MAINSLGTGLPVRSLTFGSSSHLRSATHIPRLMQRSHEFFNSLSFTLRAVYKIGTIQLESKLATRNNFGVHPSSCIRCPNYLNSINSIDWCLRCSPDGESRNVPAKSKFNRNFSNNRFTAFCVNQHFEVHHLILTTCWLISCVDWDWKCSEISIQWLRFTFARLNVNR